MTEPCPETVDLARRWFGGRSRRVRSERGFSVRRVAQPAGYAFGWLPQLENLKASMCDRKSIVLRDAHPMIIWRAMNTGAR
jgi:hypothetical protein